MVRIPKPKKSKVSWSQVITRSVEPPVLIADGFGTTSWFVRGVAPDEFMLSESKRKAGQSSTRKYEFTFNEIPVLQCDKLERSYVSRTCDFDFSGEKRVALLAEDGAVVSVRKLYYDTVKNLTGNCSTTVRFGKNGIRIVEFIDMFSVVQGIVMPMTNGEKEAGEALDSKVD